MPDGRVVVVGAGVGGLAAAALLARRGLDVTVLERAAKVGGKMREVIAGGRAVDAGPTVLTMRWVFEEIFAAAGGDLDAAIPMKRVDRIARHAFQDGSVLDLYADIAKSSEAIAELAGDREADGYRRFCAYAERIHASVEGPFLRSSKPTAMGALMAAVRLGPATFHRMDAHRTLWRALEGFFRDPRLLQLFGRYATYVGSSPFLAPATLNVIAHVERDGLFLVEGGMYRVAEALLGLARRAGAQVRTDAPVAEILRDGSGVTGVRLVGGEQLGARYVIMNGDAAALATGLLGEGVREAATVPRERSLSAIVWTLAARTSGFPLVRHNVFFSADYREEFAELGRGAIPEDPTIYVCAQDRDEHGAEALGETPERLLVLINAPACADDAATRPDSKEMQRWETRILAGLERMGLRVELGHTPSVVTTPADFARLFPATRGALYGPASHGMFSALQRGTSRTPVRGLFLAGGSVHPGAGVPMAAQSGRLAAESVIADHDSTSRSRTAATRGGISTW